MIIISIHLKQQIIANIIKNYKQNVITQVRIIDFLVFKKGIRSDSSKSDLLIAPLPQSHVMFCVRVNGLQKYAAKLISFSYSNHLLRINYMIIHFGMEQ
jgi:hypothetical protein